MSSRIDNQDDTRKVLGTGERRQLGVNRPRNSVKRDGFLQNKFKENDKKSATLPLLSNKGTTSSQITDKSTAKNFLLGQLGRTNRGINDRVIFDKTSQPANSHVESVEKSQSTLSSPFKSNKPTNHIGNSTGNHDNHTRTLSDKPPTETQRSSTINDRSSNTNSTRTLFESNSLKTSPIETHVTSSIDSKDVVGSSEIKRGFRGGRTLAGNEASSSQNHSSNNHINGSVHGHTESHVTTDKILSSARTHETTLQGSDSPSQMGKPNGNVSDRFSKINNRDNANRFEKLRLNNSPASFQKMSNIASKLDESNTSSNRNINSNKLNSAENKLNNSNKTFGMTRTTPSRENNIRGTSFKSRFPERNVRDTFKETNKPRNHSLDSSGSDFDSRSVSSSLSSNESLEISHQEINNNTVTRKIMSSDSSGEARGTEPVFDEPLTDVSLIEGDVLNLSTKIQSKSVCHVTWKRDDVEIKSSPYVKLIYKNNEAKLTVRNVAGKDSGNYSCEVKNDIGTSISTCRVDINKKPVLPVFKKRLQATVNVVEEETAEFFVNIEGSPQPEVTFTFDGKDIGELNNARVEQSGTGYHVFIENCRKEDKGRLKCFAKNSAGSIHCFSDLTVKPGPPKVKCVGDGNAVGVMGDDLDLTIELPDNQTKYKVEWFKGTKPVFRSTKKLEIAPPDNLFHRLTIKILQESDSGLYKCVVTGPTGKSTTEFHVSVKEPEGTVPKIADQSTDEVIITEGGNAEMWVAADGYPKSTATWFKEDEPLSRSLHYDIKTVDNKHWLIIKNVKFEDDAEYFCQLANVNGKADVVFSVIVERKESKPRLVKKFADVTANEGEEAFFEVKVDGYPEPTIRWLLDDEEIPDDDRYEMISDGDTHTLIIHEVESADAGIISFTAENNSGKVASKARLRVKKQDLTPVIKCDGDTTINIESGEPVRLSASVKNAMSICWIVDGKEIDETNPNVKISRDPNGCSLELKVPQAGEYTLEVVSATGKVTTKTFVLQDLTPTISIEGESEIEIKAGKPVVLSAAVTNAMSVCWLFNGEEISDKESNVKLTHVKNKYSIELKKPQAGEYTLEVVSAAGKVVMKTLNLKAVKKIMEPVRFVTYLPEEVSAIEGENVEFTIDLSRRIEDTEVIWELDGEIIAENEKTRFAQIKNSHSLIISSLTDDDEGIIEVFVLDGNDEISCACELFVKPKKVKAPPPKPKPKPKEEAVGIAGVGQLRKIAPKTIEKASSVDKQEPEFGLGKLRKVSPREHTEQSDTSAKLPFETKLRKTSDRVMKEEDKIEELKIVDKLRPCTVESDNPATFSVKLSKMVDEYHWLINGKTIQSDNLFYMMQNDNDVYILIILNCTLKDSRSKVEFVVNDDVKSSAKLLVLPSTPEIVFDKETPEKYTAGEEIVITLNIKGHLNPKVEWFKGVKKLETIPDTLTLTHTEYSTCLIIIESRVSDSGVYRCVVRSDTGNSELKFNIDVREKKEVEKHDFSFKSNREPSKLTSKTLKKDKSNDSSVNEDVIESREVETVENEAAIDFEIGDESRQSKNAVDGKRVEEKPKNLIEIVEKMKACLVTEDESATFAVTLDKPCENISWSIDHQEVSVDDTNYEFSTDETKYMFKILKCTLKDNRKVVGFKANEDNEVSCSAKITVQPVKPSIIANSDPMLEYFTGDDIPLSVTIKGHPNCTVEWFKGLKKMMNNPLRSVITSTEQESVLTIRNSNSADSGAYKCVVKSKAGTSEIKFTVKVKAKKVVDEAPTFKSELQPVEILEGEDLKLSISISGHPPPIVEWFFNEQKLQVSRRIRINRDKTEHSLTVSKVTSQDSGVYRVNATNKMQVSQTSATITIAKKEIPNPPKFLLDLVDQEIADREPVGFEVKVKDAEKVQWFVDDEEIDSDDEFEFIEDGDKYIFNIKSVEPSDTGVYECRASNKFGMSKSACTLTVTEPETPQEKLPPEIIIENMENLLEFKAGERMELKFEVSEECEVHFYKDDSLIESNDDVIIVRDGNIVRLVIEKLKSGDSGFYLLEVENEYGLSEKEVEVKVHKEKAKLPPPPSPKPKPKPKVVEEKPAPVEEIKPVEVPQVESQPVVEVESAPPKVVAPVDHRKKPVFTTKLQDVEVIEMSAARFDAAVQADPIAEFFWYKDNVEIDGRYPYRIEEDEETGESSLVIIEVSKEHRGKYKCVAINEKGKSTSTAELFVEGHGFETEGSESDLGGSSLARSSSIDSDLSEELSEDDGDNLSQSNITSPLKDQKVRLGDSVTFSCGTKGVTRRSTVEWYVNDIRMTDGLRVRITTSDNFDMFNFSLRDVRTSDNGTYKVVFKTAQGTFSSSANLEVEDIVSDKIYTPVRSKKPDYQYPRDDKPDHQEPAFSTSDEQPSQPPSQAKTTKPFKSLANKFNVKPPRFILKPRSRELSEGMQVRFTASIDGNPAPEIQWFHNDKILKAGKNVKIDTSGTLSTLEIKTLSTTDAGTYKVVASNDGGSESAEASLSVASKIIPSVFQEPSSIVPKFVNKTGDVRVTKDEDIHIKFEFNQNSKPEIEWQKNYSKMISIKRIKIIKSKDSTELKITKARLDDAGIYLVNLTNDDGIDSCQFNITVVDPDAETEDKAPDINIVSEEPIEEEKEETVSQIPRNDLGRFTAKSFDSTDEELTNLHTNEIKKQLLEIKEMHPVLQREVVRHKFPGESGIDVVVMPATPRESPVAGAAPKITKVAEDVDAIIGDNVEFFVEVEDPTNVNVSWLKEHELLLGSRRHKMFQKINRFYFTISAVDIDDEALYECKVRNEFGETSCDVQLLVDEASESESDGDEEEVVVQPVVQPVPASLPAFIKKLNGEYVVNEGEQLRLQVELIGTPPPVVEWYFEDEKIEPDEFVQIIADGGKSSLIIKETVLDDDGFYKCTARNKAGEIYIETEVKILESNEEDERSVQPKNFFTKPAEKIKSAPPPTAAKPKPMAKKHPPVFLEKLTSSKVVQGKSIDLTVKVQSSLPVDVRWWNGEELVNEQASEHIDLLNDGNTYTLRIKEAKLLDTSLYTCTVSNEGGEVSTSADLLVMPDIPGIGEEGIESNENDATNHDQHSGVSMYEAIEDYNAKSSDSLTLKRGSKVEVLDRIQVDKWLVQCSINPANIGFVDPKLLQPTQRVPSIVEPTDNLQTEATLETTTAETIRETAITSSDEGALKIKDDKDVIGKFYIAIGNFEPTFDNEVKLKEGTVCEVVDGKTTQEYWVVRFKDGNSTLEGLVPSKYLVRKDRVPSFNKGAVRSTAETRKDSLIHRNKILDEMIQTEEKYVEQLTSIVESHMEEMRDNSEGLPPALKGKSDVIFSNIADIQEFHANAFLNEMIAAGDDHDKMAKCFVNHSVTLERLYVEYCNSRPAADDILNRPEVIEFWDVYQHDIEDPHPLGAYLITPIQRITRYQLLLKEILKYTTRANEDSGIIDEALSKVSSIIRHANDSMHLKRIIGHEGVIKLEKVGKLIKMESLICWEGTKARGKGKERWMFLCENYLIGTKKNDRRPDKNDQTKEVFYSFKFSMKISDLGQTENVDGHPLRWVVWSGKSASTASTAYTLEAHTEWEKNAWVRDIRDILSKQLAYLKYADSMKRRSVPLSPLFGSPTDMDKPRYYSESEQEAYLSLFGDQGATKIGENKSKIIDQAKEITSSISVMDEEYYLQDFEKELTENFDKEKLIVGHMYRLKKAVKNATINEGDLVSLVKTGNKLYLVEPIGSEDEANKIWLPGSFLIPLAEHAEEETIQDPPVFIKQLSSLSVNDGENAVFECQIVNADTIKWYIDNKLIINDDGISVNIESNGVATLTLENVSTEDEGEYTVKASNDIGSVSMCADLKVTVPPKITESFDDVIVLPYESVTLKCFYEGIPQPEVKWYRDNIEVKDEGKYIIETSNTFTVLDIAEITEDDCGKYKCFISNEFGSAECHAAVNMKAIEKPQTPGTPTATRITDRTISISWKPSQPPITHYIVEMKRNESADKSWKVVADHVIETSCTIEGLRLGEEYDFRVISVMDSVKSNPSSSETFLIEAPRRKKTKKKTSAKSEESCDSELDAISSSSLLSPEPESKSSGRLSPFSQIRQNKGDYNSSSEEEDRMSRSERGRSTPRKSPGTQRKARSRSRSPMARKTNESRSQSSERGGAVGPPYFVKEVENCFVKEGGAAKFKCKADGNPSPEIIWFKDNEEISEGKQFTMLTDADDFAILIITQSDHDTAGSYTCVAKNSEGKAKSSAILFVEGLQTEYDTETEEEISDPEPQPDKEPVEILREDVERYYVLKEELGRGKFGIVSKCVDKVSNQEYAAKFIKCRPSERKNVINEIDIMNSLNHKRLISLIAAFESPRQLVLVLELVTGGELFEKLTEEEYISEKDVTFYMKQVLQGLQHMHDQEVLHLDLKPENIMLVNQRSTQIKLIDFGLARRFKKGDALKVLFGTPEFMAPEVINYDQVTPATDMWSLGVITYVLLSGLSPFAGDDDNETLTNVVSGEWDFDDPVFEDISDEAKDFISDLLVMKQKDRASVKDCLEHPWFMFKKFKKKIRTDRLKAFTARRKWKKTITAVRSTNFLTRLLSGIKSAQAGDGTNNKENKAMSPTPSSSNTGPAWKKAEDVEDDDFMAPQFESKLSDMKIRRGDVAHFKVLYVRSSDDPTPPITCWKKEGKIIEESKRVVISHVKNEINLKLINSQINDTGRYTVRLENQNGSTECSCQLIIQDIPSAPRAPTVPQVLATSALVQWRPVFDGNAPIKSYQLQYRKLGDKEWSVFKDEIKELVTVVEDLEPSSSYRFRVSATNDIGTSEMSDTTPLIKTPAQTGDPKRSSINAPGARRLSRSSSIKLPSEMRARSERLEIRLKEENPEVHYNFKEEIGRGKFAVVRKCVSKATGDTFAAKTVKYDEDTMEITKKEYEIWRDLSHENLILLHDAYFVRKYLILVCDLVKGVAVLDYLSRFERLTENEVAFCVKQVLLALEYLHAHSIVHLDIKPSNVIMRGSTLKLIDYGSSRQIKTKGGEVVEAVGTAEFMAPETINFEPVTFLTDMWSVGVVTYALLSGISPFATDDEDETMSCISALDYRFEPSAFATITEEAKTFIKNLIKRIPEKRPSADICLEDPWLSESLENARKASLIQTDMLTELSDALDEQERLEDVHASLVLRTFLQSPYDSPESESESEDETGNA